MRIAQVDVRAEQIGRRAPVDLGIVGDVGPTLEGLLPLLDENRNRRHLDQATEHCNRGIIRGSGEYRAWRDAGEYDSLAACQHLSIRPV